VSHNGAAAFAEFDAGRPAALQQDFRCERVDSTRKFARASAGLRIGDGRAAAPAVAVVICQAAKPSCCAPL